MRSHGHRNIARFLWTVLIVFGLLERLPRADEPPAQGPYEELSQGKDCGRHWRGRPHLDPREEAKLDADTRAARQRSWNEDRDAHWKIVPVEDGAPDGAQVLVSDGQGVFLTSAEDYGDFDLEMEWRMMAPKADSGIYLRGSPQVQIWDPADPDAIKNGADKGSGALWNNADGAPGKWPLVKADRPIGEWNLTRIRMVGARVWVWMNGQATVDGAVLENYWDRAEPMFPRGPIQLQTHGGEIQFRGVRIRAISGDEANAILLAANRQTTPFQPLFDGRSLDGWDGPKESARVEDGSIVCQHGTLYTTPTFGDFVLQLEFLVPPGANNGLAIRYPGSGDAAYDGMCELQVLEDTDPKYATIDPRQAHGSAYGMVAAKRGFQRTPGQWNHQLVTVRGSTIKVELNGTPILDCDLSQVKEFMDGKEHPGLNVATGHLGLCGHGDPVRFRNFEIHPLE